MRAIAEDMACAAAAYPSVLSILGTWIKSGFTPVPSKAISKV
jgi:hypothetical protein